MKDDYFNLTNRSTISTTRSHYRTKSVTDFKNSTLTQTKLDLLINSDNKNNLKTNKNKIASKLNSPLISNEVKAKINQIYNINISKSPQITNFNLQSSIKKETINTGKILTKPRL
jgi:hypothetical protein